jgi:hypothetical protein
MIRALMATKNKPVRYLAARVSAAEESEERHGQSISKHCDAECHQRFLWPLSSAQHSDNPYLLIERIARRSCCWEQDFVPVARVSSSRFIDVFLAG